jgi:hypothetical protein
MLIRWVRTEAKLASPVVSICAVRLASDHGLTATLSTPSSRSPKILYPCSI